MPSDTLFVQKLRELRFETVDLDPRSQRRSWCWNCEIFKLKVILTVRSEPMILCIRKPTCRRGTVVSLQCGFVSLGETENLLSLSSPWHPARESSTAEGRVLMSASR